MERKLDLNELFETFVKYIGLFCNNENIKDQNQIWLVHKQYQIIYQLDQPFVGKVSVKE